jgi:hypothetical protein
MADLTEIDELLCERSRWDFSDLRARQPGAPDAGLSR